MSKEKIAQKTDELIEQHINLTSEKQIVRRIDNDYLEIDGAKYKIIENNRESIDLEALENRYTSFFEKFHYIVGDLSKDQLRLKGFYKDDQKNVPIDLKINTVEDYLAEYCSYGCSYFIIERLDDIKNFQPYNDQDYSNKKNHRSKKSRRSKKSKRSKRQRNHKGKSNKESKQSSKPQFKKKEKKEPIRSNQKTENVKTVKDHRGKAKFKIKKRNDEKPKDVSM